MVQLNYTLNQPTVTQRAAANATGAKGMAMSDNRPMRHTAPAIVQRQVNNTGLPDNLKTGIENLSGMRMDHVQVHYNSAQPAQLNAHAYAQGNQIHIAPGQEKHLPHEAWHVVQQAQGRVRPTMQLRGKVNVNDDKGLEKEADVMGAKAVQIKKTVQLKNVETLVHSPVIQRWLHVGGVDNRIRTLSPQSLEKIQQVNTYIATMGPNHPIEKNIQISVVNNNRTMPAYTDEDGENLNVYIQSWYVDIATIGEMVGMINHELGVHTLANATMTDDQKQQETAANPNDHTVRVGFRNHTLTGWTADDDNWDDANRQKDHLNVVKDDGVAPVRPRVAAYADTMLRMGDAIEADLAIDQPKKDKRLQDMLKTFLFDHARILVTNDGKILKTGLKTHIIADVMDWYRTVIIDRHAAAHPWLHRPAVQPNAGGWGLRAWLVGQLAMGLGAQFNHSAIGQGRVGAIARAPFHAANAIADSRVGVGVRAVANAPGIRHAGMLAGAALGFAGNVTGTALRYGEMLVQDSVSLASSAVSGVWGLTKRLFGGGQVHPHQP